ncbi:hypothetical protein [Blautia obeum]|uniref:hypothetical protein n=1 Tax=Blautia obeum TaxID=40520 RepID=UPI003D00CD5C
MNSRFYTAKEVSEMLDVSQAKAYQIIKGLNNELSDKGYITISGKIPKAYFNEKCYGEQVI